MDFFSDTAWWTSFAAALAASTVSALSKPIKSFRFLFGCLTWLAAVVLTGMTCGIFSAIAAFTFSLLWALLLFVLTLLFSGVKLMEKKRYG